MRPELIGKLVSYKFSPYAIGDFGIICSIVPDCSVQEGMCVHVLWAAVGIKHYTFKSFIIDGGTICEEPC